MENPLLRDPTYEVFTSETASIEIALEHVNANLKRAEAEVKGARDIETWWHKERNSITEELLIDPANTVASDRLDNANHEFNMATLGLIILESKQVEAHRALQEQVLRHARMETDLESFVTSWWQRKKGYVQKKRKAEEAPQGSHKRVKQEKQSAEEDQMLEHYEAKQHKVKTELDVQMPSHTEEFKYAVQQWRWLILRCFAAYSTMKIFPDPPLVKTCKKPLCNTTSRALQACPCNIKAAFDALPDQGLGERLRWHPDRFSSSPSKHRELFQKKAREIFGVLDAKYRGQM